MERLPDDICAMIYEWDPTYLCILRDRVHAELRSLDMVLMMMDRQFTTYNYMEPWAVPPPCVINGRLYIRGIPQR